jgi:hypothetical protein
MRFVYQHGQGWPEPYIYTVYDHMFGDFPAKDMVYTPYICMVLLAYPKFGITAWQHVLWVGGYTG